MSLERNSYLLFPYGQRLAAAKLSLAQLQSRCSAHLAVPSLPHSSSTPHLSGAGYEDQQDGESFDSGSSHLQRYSIYSYSNDLEYISLFNQEVMKVECHIPVKGSFLLTCLLVCISPSLLLAPTALHFHFWSSLLYVCSMSALVFIHRLLLLCVHIPS